MVKELDLKLTLGMAERRNTESSPGDEELSRGRGPAVQISVRAKTHSFSETGCFSVPVGHSSNVKNIQKYDCHFLPKIET